MNREYTVFLVDDDILVLQALRDQLQPTFPNITFETCQSGEEALELVEQVMEDGATVAAVISDHLMDGMTGAELLIRLQAVVPKARKIMLTGQAGLEAISVAVNAGALYRYMSKPWDVEDMRLTLYEALQAYSTDARLAERNAELEKLNSQLEASIAQRTRQLLEKNTELEEGLEYAGRVQRTLFPEFTRLSEHVRAREIYLRPYNGVSGDFYWMSNDQADGRLFLAVGDCTGHGISGGFMSVMHIAALNEAMFRCTDLTPLGILHYMDGRIKDITTHTYKLHRTLIGAETTLLCFDPDGHTVHFASNSKGLIVRDLETGEVSEPLQALKRGINGASGSRDIVSGCMDLRHRSELYLFTDGVVDQFGGPNGKKLKRSGLVKWIAERERTAVDMQRFSDYFDTFAEGQMIVDDALMLILSTG
jgi:FixJ family two-component response regulator